MCFRPGRPVLRGISPPRCWAQPPLWELWPGAGPGAPDGLCAFIVPYLVGQTLDSGPPLGSSSVKPLTMLGVQRIFYCMWLIGACGYVFPAMADPEKERESSPQGPDPCLVLGQEWDTEGGDRKGAFVGRQSPEPGTVPTRPWVLLDLKLIGGATPGSQIRKQRLERRGASPKGTQDAARSPGLRPNPEGP